MKKTQRTLLFDEAWEEATRRVNEPFEPDRTGITWEEVVMELSRIVYEHDYYAPLRNE